MEYRGKWRSKGALFEHKRTGGHVGRSETLVDRLISWPVGQNGQRAGTRVPAADG
jgi:hypothetical protein